MGLELPAGSCAVGRGAWPVPAALVNAGCLVYCTGDSIEMAGVGCGWRGLSPELRSAALCGVPRESGSAGLRWAALSGLAAAAVGRGCRLRRPRLLGRTVCGPTSMGAAGADGGGVAHPEAPGRRALGARVCSSLTTKGFDQKQATVGPWAQECALFH